MRWVAKVENVMRVVVIGVENGRVDEKVAVASRIAGYGRENGGVSGGFYGTGRSGREKFGTR